MTTHKSIQTPEGRIAAKLPAAAAVGGSRSWRRRSGRGVGLLAVSAGLVFGVRGQGIPEPDLVLYGTVVNVWNGANVRVIDGNLTWTYQPAGAGSPTLASTTMADLENQFSYVLRIPCEFQIIGFPSTPGTVPLTSGGISFDRSEVSWNGHPATLVVPAQATTSLSIADRGRIERLDLTVSVEIEGGDNGLPVDWQLEYFGRTGVDPLADPDGDGSNTRAEYLAGTDPTDADSALAFVGVGQVGGENRLEWSSVAGRSYAVQRSTSAAGGFEDVATGVAAAPPVNVWVDESAPGPGPYYYRLRLEP
jgi:hypothetical protein